MKNITLKLLIVVSLNFILFVVAVDRTAGEEQILLSAGGNLNGYVVNASNFVIEVAPSDPISGTIEISVFNEQPPSSVLPVGANITWGDRTVEWQTIDPWIPPGWNNLTVNVNKVAPANKGVYHIVMGAAPRFNAAQVMSATSANCGSTAIWNDGNDLGWDWDYQEFNASREFGFTTIPTWVCSTSTFVDQVRGVNWVEVRVIDGIPDQILLDQGGNLNGHVIDSSNFTCNVVPGEHLLGSINL